MEIKLTVPAKYLAALKLFMAKQDVRFYLKGIALEIGKHETRMVATDGTVAAACRLLSDQPEITETPVNVILPDTLLHAIKAKGDAVIHIGPREAPRNSCPVRISYAGVDYAGTSTDGVYPPWRRIVPTKVSGELAQFNPEIVALVGKAACLIRGKNGPMHVSVGHNGGAAALVDFNDEAFMALISPNKIKTPTAPAAWVHEYV